MVGHEGSSAGSYLADPTSPIPSHCASIVVTSTVRVNCEQWQNTRMSCLRSHYVPLFLQTNRWWHSASNHGTVSITPAINGASLRRMGTVPVVHVTRIIQDSSHVNCMVMMSTNKEFTPVAASECIQNWVLGLAERCILKVFQHT